MTKHEGDGTNRARRDKTDESLRLEREKADLAAEKKQDALEADADEVVRSGRLLADQVLRNAREEADREQSQSAASQLERRHADVLLDHERSTADAVLEAEPAVKRRHLAELLAGEREATDNDLKGERADADAAFSNSEQLLAAVSHDLRSLVAGLLLNGELVAKCAPDGAAGDVLRQHADTSKRLVTRMNRLVNDLVDLASIEAGKFSVVRERVELSVLLRDAFEALEPIAAARNITLVVDAEALPRHAKMDPDRILQVLGNLVGNAVKFTPADGRITLRFRCERDELQLAVSDTGRGIPENALPTVFERFRKVKHDRTGLGLGLYISKCIVEAHSGKMWIESQLGAGTTVHVALPSVQVR